MSALPSDADAAGNNNNGGGTFPPRTPTPPSSPEEAAEGWLLRWAIAPRHHLCASVSASTSYNSSTVLGTLQTPASVSTAVTVPAVVNSGGSIVLPPPLNVAQFTIALEETSLLRYICLAIPDAHHHYAHHAHGNGNNAMPNQKNNGSGNGGSNKQPLTVPPPVTSPLTITVIAGTFVHEASYRVVLDKAPLPLRAARGSSSSGSHSYSHRHHQQQLCVFPLSEDWAAAPQNPNAIGATFFDSRQPVIANFVTIELRGSGKAPMLLASSAASGGGGGGPPLVQIIGKPLRCAPRWVHRCLSLSPAGAPPPHPTNPFHPNTSSGSALTIVDNEKATAAATAAALLGRVASEAAPSEGSTPSAASAIAALCAPNGPALTSAREALLPSGGGTTTNVIKTATGAGKGKKKGEANRSRSVAVGGLAASPSQPQQRTRAVSAAPPATSDASVTDAAASAPSAVVRGRSATIVPSNNSANNNATPTASALSASLLSLASANPYEQLFVALALETQYMEELRRGTINKTPSTVAALGGSSSFNYGGGGETFSTSSSSGAAARGGGYATTIATPKRAAFVPSAALLRFGGGGYDDDGAPPTSTAHLLATPLFGGRGGGDDNDNGTYATRLTNADSSSGVFAVEKLIAAEYLRLTSSLPRTARDRSLHKLGVIRWRMHPATGVLAQWLAAGSPPIPTPSLAYVMTLPAAGGGSGFPRLIVGCRVDGAGAAAGASSGVHAGGGANNSASAANTTTSTANAAAVNNSRSRGLSEFGGGASAATLVASPSGDAAAAALYQQQQQDKAAALLERREQRFEALLATCRRLSGGVYFSEEIFLAPAALAASLAASANANPSAQQLEREARRADDIARLVEANLKKNASKKDRDKEWEKREKELSKKCAGCKGSLWFFTSTQQCMNCRGTFCGKCLPTQQQHRQRAIVGKGVVDAIADVCFECSKALTQWQNDSTECSRRRASDSLGPLIAAREEAEVRGAARRRRLKLSAVMEAVAAGIGMASGNRVERSGSHAPSTNSFSTANLTNPNPSLSFSSPLLQQNRSFVHMFFHQQYQQQQQQQQHSPFAALPPPLRRAAQQLLVPCVSGCSGEENKRSVAGVIGARSVTLPPWVPSRQHPARGAAAARAVC